MASPGRQLESALPIALSRYKSSEPTLNLRNFTWSTLRRRTKDDASDLDSLGPLGLTVLHEPSEPLVELVFVHGLGGGSRKTWSKDGDPALYWPEVWLPLEPQFKHVRVHTFGYHSDWKDVKGSLLTVHDFGQALLAEIHNSSVTGGEKHENPIVFVAHSMGGIVVKKAVIQAKQDPTYQSVAARIHSIFFLAVPHRGSDLASWLHNVLLLSSAHGAKSYVEDLIPNSQATYVINDQFRHVYQDIQIWSFFETMKTRLGIIVDKSSAILGLPGERVQLLNADHRHVCKFSAPSDADYCTLKNALAAAVSAIENTWFSARREEYNDEMKRLARFLGTSNRPDTDLAILTDLQIQDSCQWLTDKESFHKWREGLDHTPKVFWLRGDPATGKSTVMAHVIKYLEGSNAECSFFFFKNNIKGKFTVAELLLSLAWQMAASNTIVRKKLLAMHDDGVAIDFQDPAMLWRTIFLSQILHTEVRQPHFWVIDALDECANAATLCHYLAKLDSDMRVRVIISSRPDLNIERSFSQDRLAVTVESTSLETSLEDIRTFLNAHAQHLPVDNESERQDLMTQILDKSNGNFLWTTLVVKELEESFSQERTAEILRSVPEGINQLYSRILRTIIARNDNGEIAKSILRWVLCSPRPLTIDELREALTHDIKQTVSQLQKTASTICGHLIYVDDSGYVFTKHQTVKDYLFRIRCPDDGDFVFDRNQEHGRIAEVCLSFLCSDALKTVRFRGRNMSTRHKARPPFTDYAAALFSGHLAHTTSSDDRHLLALNKFLLTNSLTWIEVIADRHDLGYLTETAKNLKAFMERRAKYRSPLGKEVQNVLRWADDLIRVVAQFGRALASSPSSIHFLIPPVCPSDSILFQNFAKYRKPLQLVGLSRTSWDDRLCCITSAPSRVICVACSASKVALGLNNGRIHVYLDKTFELSFVLHHGELVRRLTFSHARNLLAAGSLRRVAVWDLTSGAEIWSAAVSEFPLSFQFTEDDGTLVAATRDNKIIFWDAMTGQVARPSTTFSDFDEERATSFGNSQSPIFIDVSPGLGLLGVVYRMRPITFWELDDGSFSGQYHKTEASSQEAFVHAFIFNPEPSICLAAVAFQDGDICVFDPFSQNTQAKVHCDTSCLTSSPNGTILASGDGQGVIKLFDFETLHLLYQINSYEENIRSVTFSVNGLRLYDIRGTQCNIWEPSVLVRRVSSGDDASIDNSDRIEDQPHFITARTPETDNEITAVVAHHGGDYLLCGLECGDVKVFSTKTGKSVQKLFQHPNRVGILFLVWHEIRNILICVDRTGRVLIQHLRLTIGGQQVFTVDNTILDFVCASAVQQVLLDPSGKLLLMMHSEKASLLDLHTQEVVYELALQDSDAVFWLNHPSNNDQVLLMRNGTQVQVLEWETMHVLSGPKTLDMGNGSGQQTYLRWVNTTPSSRRIGMILAKDQYKGAFSMLAIYSSEVLSLDNKDTQPIAASQQLAKIIKQPIGLSKTMLIFLNLDDWICSIDLDSATQISFYTRHFYIPQQWLGSSSTMQLLVTSKGDIVLVSMDELAIFRDGLDYEERINISNAGSDSNEAAYSLQRPVLRKGTSCPV